MPQKVLYVAGAGRSGSTLFGNVLGQLDGFAAFGELYNFPLRFLEERYCGCGARLSECSFWQSVLQACHSCNTKSQIKEWVTQRDQVARARHILAWRTPQVRRQLLRQSEALRKTVGYFYHSIAQVAETRVIVDTSKTAGYAQVLAWTPDIELYVVHLIRDPRAVAYSWARRKPKQTPAGTVAISPTSPLRGALKWLAHNLATELYRGDPELRYLQVRYEDFVQDPEKVLTRVLDFVGERSSIPIGPDKTLNLSPQHTVDGNPDRFQVGRISLMMDDEWKQKLDWHTRTLITFISAPLLRRYGYI